MDNDEQDHAENPSSLDQKSFSIALNKDLSSRLKKHIQLLKNLKIDHSKQAWIQKAVEEKLQRKNAHEHLDDEFFHFKINSEIHREVRKEVDLIREFRTSYSQKKWFLEAFYEKLNRDEQEIKKMMQDKLDSFRNLK